MEHHDITEKIIGCSMKVHSLLEPGFVELVYQNALAFELRKAGLTVECEKQLTVFYEEEMVGGFCCDMVICDVVLVENKALRALTPAHEAQLVNYLTATGFDVGLLLNFGAPSLEFKRKTRSFRRRTT